MNRIKEIVKFVSYLAMGISLIYMIFMLIDFPLTPDYIKTDYFRINLQNFLIWLMIAIGVERIGKKVF